MTRALVGAIDPARGEIRTAISPDVIDAESREVIVGGERIPYGAIVAALPLPELLKRTRGLPPEIERAATKLRCTPVRYLNVGTRKPPPADFHWIYVPEEKY